MIYSNFDELFEIDNLNMARRRRRCKEENRVIDLRGFAAGKNVAIASTTKTSPRRFGSHEQKFILAHAS